MIALSILCNPSLKYLVFDQDKIDDNINKRLYANGKMLDNINAKLNDLSFAIKSKLRFNKMLQTQFAQLASTTPSFEKGRILGI